MEASIKNTRIAMTTGRNLVDPYSSDDFDVEGDSEILVQVEDIPQIQNRKMIIRSASNTSSGNSSRRGKRSVGTEDSSSAHSNSSHRRGGGPAAAAYFGYEVGASPKRNSSFNSKDGHQSETDKQFVKSLRRGSMSREQNQQNLKDSLSAMSEYSEDRSSEKIKADLKDYLGGPKKNLKNKPLVARRSSISSVSSAAFSIASSFRGDHEEEEVSLSFADEVSIDIRDSDLDLNFSRKSSCGSGQMSFDMSTSTAPMNNLLVKAEKDKMEKLAIKTEQIVESLVWFSFHTPRTVLEDLIANELDVYRKRHIKQISDHGRKKEYQLGGHLYGGQHNHGQAHGIYDDHSVTEVSEVPNEEYGEKDFRETMMRAQDRSTGKIMLKLPKSVPRESALLFVDMSGFTKLSTMLDVESLSKVINSYFDMIVSEVILYGGDILKFAGDAFFAEWKISEDVSSEESMGCKGSALSQLNQSLASINDFNFHDDAEDKLSACVLSAARCAASIVAKFSDFKVLPGSSDTMLNVHCGVGVGPLVGLHVGDFKEGEEDAVELRREFLLLGSAIDQVSDNS